MNNIAIRKKNCDNEQNLVLPIKILGWNSMFAMFA